MHCPHGAKKDAVLRELKLPEHTTVIEGPFPLPPLKPIVGGVIVERCSFCGGSIVTSTGGVRFDYCSKCGKKVPPPILYRECRNS